ncbi:MAG: hypothetical protein HKN92_08290 [Chitinophagales bacterium]|nr:hypothetical protein [Chitinophagales bacterium]
MKLRVAVILFLIISSVSLQAQTKAPQIVTALDPYDQALIGDHVTLTLSLEVPESTYVMWPVQIDTFTNFDILEVSNIDSLESEGTLRITQAIILSAYDSGIFLVAPLPFEFYKTGQDTLRVRTAALALQVNTVAIDTSAPLKAIKPPIEVPISFAEIWPWLIAGLLIIGIIALAIYLMKRQASKVSTPNTAVAQIPPHMLAMRKLDELENKKLWQQDRIKEYYSRLSEITREYIENRYRILALESTTDEILSNLKHELISIDDMEKLEKVLRLSDLVKFAKVKPLPDEHSASLVQMREFVRSTIPVIVQRKEEEVADV